MIKRRWICDFRAEEQHTSILGGKGLNLFKLMEFGVPVPPFGVVSTDAHRDYLDHGGKLNPAIVEQIMATVKSWDTDHVAVRSSMSAEDGASRSYAGMMESFLYVEPGQIGPMIIRCFDSMNAERVKAYENHEQDAGGKEKSPQKAAVIIQKMVHSAVSGVAFSRSPLFDSALTHIEAGIGLGEGVVSGLVEIDSFALDRFHNVIRSKVSRKTKALMFDNSKTSSTRLAEIALPEETGNKPALNREQLVMINQALLDLERRMGFGVDIEWAFEPSAATPDGKLYFLQIRPITANFGRIRCYIDTNLSESYPGNTSPLTASFVTLAYSKTFLESFEYLKVSAARILMLKKHLDNLVRNIGGHMYYDLVSYYAVLGALPGGAANIARWHQMIGGAVYDQGASEQIAPLSGWEDFKSHLQILKMYLFHDGIFGRFVHEADSYRQRLIEELAQADDSRKIAAFLAKAISSTKGFGLTALNDLLIMILIKAISGFLDRRKIALTNLPALFKTAGGVDSLHPMQELKKILGAINDPAAFLALFERFLADQAVSEWDGEQSYEKLYPWLTDHGFAAQASQLAQYVTKYGQRSFEELKIESLTIKQSPRLLYQIMRLLASGNEPLAAASSTGSKRDFCPDDLGFFERQMFRFLSYYTHKTIRTREKTRLVRGEYYDIVRSAIMLFFKALRRENPGSFANYTIMDCFGLTLPTIFSYGRDSSTINDLKAEIDHNLGFQSNHVDYPECLCLAEGDKPYFLDKTFTAVIHGGGQNGLGGLGASSGVVEGVVLRLENPTEAFGATRLFDRILVTRTTDPAWVFIMSQCCGLVSEKGSLLSHTAIIGREMGIPTVVAAQDAMSKLKNGDRIRIDGELGTIEILGPQAVEIASAGRED